MTTISSALVRNPAPISGSTRSTEPKFKKFAANASIGGYRAHWKRRSSQREPRTTGRKMSRNMIAPSMSGEGLA